jgi:hypothetical protein
LRAGATAARESRRPQQRCGERRVKYGRLRFLFRQRAAAPISCAWED